LIKEKAQLDIQTKRGNTALMVAAANGDERLIQLFIDKRARLDIRNRDGVTALDIAMKSNNAAAAKRLEAAMTGKRSSKK
jgi:ankyrin repeat protein